MPPAPALIFDLDGTLVDTAPDLLGATNAVLEARGRPPIDPSTLRHMVGFGAQRLITPGDGGDRSGGSNGSTRCRRWWRYSWTIMAPIWPISAVPFPGWKIPWPG